MSTRAKEPVDLESFEEIEAAVRETERGRWFLDEYRRRLAQPSPSHDLLGAVSRIERAIGQASVLQQATISSLTRRVMAASRDLPGLAEKSGRIASQTRLASDVIEGLSTLPGKQLSQPASRETLKQQTAHLKGLAHEQRDMFIKLKTCVDHFESIGSELADSLAPGAQDAADPVSLADIPPMSAAARGFFREDEEIFANPVAQLQAQLKLVAGVQDEAETEAPAAKITSSRITIVTGDAEPPLPDMEAAFTRV